MRDFNLAIADSLGLGVYYISGGVFAEDAQIAIADPLGVLMASI